MSPTMPARKGNRYNFLVVFTVALGSFTYGFNTTVIGSVLGLPSFWTYFGLSIEGTSDIIGAASGVFFGGGMIGGAASAWVSDHMGRKKTLALTCLLGIAGGILQAASVHIAMFLVGRTLNGLCCGMIQTVVPVYQSEVSPPAQRGRMVGSHGTLVVTGAAFAAWVGVGCFFASNAQLQWRLTLALTLLAPLLLLIAVPVLPESPRWLLQTGKYEKAMETLRKLHATPDDPYELLPREEYIQIRKQIELERSEKRTFSRAIKEPSTRKRLIIGMLIPFLLQSTGVLVTTNYQVILYQDLDITGWLALTLLALYTSWAAFLNWVNSMILDRVGRVRSLLIGITGSSVSLICYTAMVANFAGTHNRVGCGFGVFFVYLFVTFYGIFLDVTGYVYWTEIFPNSIRSAGVAVSIMSFFGTALVYNQVAPLAFATITWKFYIVFIIVPTLGLPVIYFYLPETTRLSLEEISAVFGDQVAVDITHLTDDQREKFDKEIKDYININDGKDETSTGMADGSAKGDATQIERVT